jgi:hypothetical protein
MPAAYLPQNVLFVAFQVADRVGSIDLEKVCNVSGEITLLTPHVTVMSCAPPHQRTHGPVPPRNSVPPASL